MSILDGFFGSKRDLIWQRLADEVGGNFFEGGLSFGGSKVRARVDGWVVTLDTYRNEHGTTVTRIHAPYISAAEFTFTLFRRRSFEDRHRTGHVDVETGAAEFDAAFVTESNDADKVRKLFADDKIRQLLWKQREVHVHARHDDGWLSDEFPGGMHELSIEVRGEITNLARLKELYELFGETLHQLCRIGAAVDKDPGIVI
jgi:hypothetical protein